MSSAKEIRVAPIGATTANECVQKWHYSGSYVHNSSLHLGVFLKDILGGVMSFGPSMDKRKTIGLVRDTKWNGFLELNRMAFSEILPRNSESRALGVAFRLIKKQYPHIEWILSFADGTQCGDGTIYRASGFVLTGIKENNQIYEAPDGKRYTRMILTQPVKQKCQMVAAQYGIDLKGRASIKLFEEVGFKPLKGFQLRYIKFLYPDMEGRLTVPIIPFSRIKELGASMYLGISRGEKSSCTSAPGAEGGALPTSPLQKI